MDLSPQRKKYNIKIPEYYVVSKKSKGYVYIVKIDNYIKIGSTHNLKNRLNSYKSFPPFNFELLLAKEVEDRVFYERALQACMLELQEKGEWFHRPAVWEDCKKGANDLFKYIEQEIKTQIKDKQ